MITVVEAIAIALFVVVAPIWALVGWPRFIREARSGTPGVRVRAYLQVIATQWAVTIALLLCWALSGRSWETLGFAPPGAAAFVGLGLVVVVAVLAVIQVRGLRVANEETQESVRKQFADTLLFLPHDAHELRWFGGVAATAGFCEEVVYRGALPIFLSAWMPMPWAIVAATLAFALGHAYQTPAAIPKVAVAGAVLALVTWLTGSLWTAMALHAVVDLHGGSVAWAVTSRRAAG